VSLPMVAMCRRGETECHVLMAQVLGEPGRYVSRIATNLRHAMWNRVGLGIGGLGVIAGLGIGCSFRWFALAPWQGVLVSVVALLAMLLVAKWCFRRLDELECTREHMRKGAAGEARVGLVLENFPDEFHVVNDLATPFGNLDHVVIGPTGVFVIDTKDWRGVVAADDHGEVTCNGQKLDRPYVRRFVARVMDAKKKVQVLAPGFDSYFQAVFVFTSAYVEAKIGATRTVHCIREDQLFDYIVNRESGKKLSLEAVEKISQAFLGLATMEAGFSEETLRRDGSKTPNAYDPALDPAHAGETCMAGARS
jgi:hypothetical protein